MSNKPQTPCTHRARTQALAADIYQTHRRRLLAIATRNSPTIDDAEEALHDTFAIFIDHFDPDSQAPPVAWLTLTLKRRCWASYRRQRLSRHAPTPATEPQHLRHLTAPHATQPLPDEIVEIADTVSQMRSHLAALKPDQRHALSLLAFGYSYTEIAQLTGWTYTKVNRCISEGRAAIRDREHRSPHPDQTTTPPRGANSPSQTLNNP
jgi:RNA polymerase sigma factor (sigma-70 family)